MSGRPHTLWMCLMTFAFCPWVMTSNVCSEDSLHGIRCHQLLSSALELTAVQPEPKFNDGDDVLSNAPSNIGFDVFTNQVVNIPTRLRFGTQRYSRPFFTRHSRGRLNRMPLHFGKRSPRTDSDDQLALTRRINKLVKSRLESLLQSSPDWGTGGGTPHYIKHAENEDVINGYPMTGTDKKSSEIIDEFWNEKRHSGEKEIVNEEFGNEIPERAPRGTLDRMPLTFGKRGTFELRPNGGISPFISSISSHQSPAYEHAIKRLRTFGIAFLRGNRARLSRMPQLYGRKKRDVKVDNNELFQTHEGVNEDSSKNTDDDKKPQEVKDGGTPVDLANLNSTPSQENTHLITSEENNRLLSQSKRHPAYLRDFISFLKLKLRSGKFPDRMWSTVEQPPIQEERRSSISRMPLTFGRRAQAGVKSATSQLDHTSVLHEGRLFHPRLDEHQTNRVVLYPLAYTKNEAARKMVAEERSKLSDEEKAGVPFELVNSASSKSLPSSTTYSNNVHLTNDARISLRSALNRMPMSFGKRTLKNGEEVQKFPHFKEFAPSHPSNGKGLSDLYQSSSHRIEQGAGQLHYTGTSLGRSEGKTITR